MTFEIFYGKKSVFSNFHPSIFHLDGLMFKSVEQYYQYNKASMFGDQLACELIMSETNPARIKAIGRRVKGFDENRWTQKCLDFIYIGNMEKYKQNASLRYVLFATRGKLMVEASPTDSRFGIGMSKTDKNVYNQELWCGANWMGYILTQVREELLHKFNQSKSYPITWTWQTLVENPRAKFDGKDRKRVSLLSDIGVGLTADDSCMVLCQKCALSDGSRSGMTVSKRRRNEKHIKTRTIHPRHIFRVPSFSSKSRRPARAASRTASRLVKETFAKMYKEEDDEEK